MAYSDFSLEDVIFKFGLVQTDVELFANLEPIAPSQWLQETFKYSLNLGLASGSEKARSEFVVVPILLEMERRNHKRFGIYSGKNLDVDKTEGLTGECDFILAKGEYTRILKNPIFALVEAKKQDIDLGLGQCSAQMVAAQLFNQQQGNSIDTIFGCVTTGDIWQFLRLTHPNLSIDLRPYYINELEKILAVLQRILDCF